MHGRALVSVFSLVVICAVATPAQIPSVSTQLPTPGPPVTAENEDWYLRGEPITFDGHFYYPSGPAVHFNRNEMTRSGFYRGIPLYSRTTIEPFSMMYVPIGGGLMQPYERPRFGEVAGTVGSLGSSFPVPMADTRRILTDAPQAPSAPTNLPNTIANRTVGIDAGGTPPLGPAPVGTTGAVAEVPRAAATAGRAVVVPRPRGFETVLRPTGANDIYIEYNGIRWFSSGPPASIDRASLTLTGEHRGFPVYMRRGDPSTIFIPTTVDADAALARYSRR